MNPSSNLRQACAYMNESGALEELHALIDRQLFDEFTSANNIESELDLKAVFYKRRAATEILLTISNLAIERD